MNIRSQIKFVRNSLLNLCCVMLVGVNASYADPGDLAQQPLFLGVPVQPNIFLGVDDSGSMDFSVIEREGVDDAIGRNLSGSIDFTPNELFEDLELCLGGNTLAYNPDFTYQPWVGEDEEGNDYADQTDITAALNNPYLSTGGTRNLTSHIYGVWTDNNNDGVYQAGECPDGGSVDFESFGDRDFSDVRWIEVDDLSAAQQTNYANWYTYFRLRDFVTKRALLQLVNDSNNRIGMASFFSEVGQPVRDMTVAANKETLMDAIGQLDPQRDTPLRRFAESIGRYFDEADTDPNAISEDGEFDVGGGAIRRSEQFGFPNDSPILPAGQGGECQQNFSLLFTDGLYNGFLGLTNVEQGTFLPTGIQFGGIGEGEGVGNPDGDGNSAFDGGSYADTVTNTLADVAMFYYEKDLSTSLPNVVPTIDGTDENNAQHLVTFGVGLGVQGTLDADAVQAQLEANPDDPFAWPKPERNNPLSIDDLQHAAWNGRGDFLTASDPDELLNSLEAVFDQIDQRLGTATASTFNSNELDSDTQIFLTQFNSADWSGDVIGFDLDTDGSLITPEAFSVQSSLDAIPLNLLNQRTIYTSYNNNDLADPLDGNGILFKWDNVTDQLADAQKSDLMTDPDGSINSDVDLAQARLAFLRGDRTHEADNTTYDFRERGSRLGDMVHSGPTFVGAPDALYPDADPFGAAGERYSAFVAANVNRDGMIYVGANDGMLHGFRTENGQEELAYIPSTLFASGAPTTGLHYLTDPNYVHTFYVDLPVSTADVYINTSLGSLGGDDWTTVLVGGLRGGGKGVFALDITDPSFANTTDAARNTVLWEFDDANTDLMGLSVSQPSIVLLNNGEWAAIFGNGYNSDDGDAALIILYIEEGIDGEWDAGDFEIIRTESGNTADPNGLGQVTVVDLDGDQVIDRVYGGDIDGAVWAFDLASDNSDDWEVAYQSGGSPEPLFVATDGNPATVPPPLAQPVTVAGAITRVTESTLDNGPNVLVILGSGQFLTTADPLNTDTQTIYGVWDAGVSNIDRTDLLRQEVLEGPTLAQVLAAAPDNSNAEDGLPDPDTPEDEALLRFVSDNEIDYNNTDPANGDLGWYLDLPFAGERVVIDPLVFLNQVFVATTIPNPVPCDSGGGAGFIMALETENGGAPNSQAFTEFNNDADVDSDPNGFAAGIAFTNGLPAGLGTLSGTGRLFITGTGGQGNQSDDTSAEDINDFPDDSPRRLSWQEIFQ